MLLMNYAVLGRILLRITVTSSYSHQKVTSLAYLISYFLNIVTKLLYQLL